MADEANTVEKKTRRKRGEGEKIVRRVFLMVRPTITDADGNPIALPEGAKVGVEVIKSVGDKRKALDMFLESRNDTSVELLEITL